MGVRSSAVRAGPVHVPDRWEIDSDNGSEFISDYLLEYCHARQITFARSRPGNRGPSDPLQIWERAGVQTRSRLGAGMPYFPLSLAMDG
jgi:hypothetical protein